jgi:polyvinyl alcohol dehydrogenase (cytochrome)
MTWRKRMSLITGAALVACSLAAAAEGTAAASGGTASWTVSGQNTSNTRNQPAESAISAANVANLKVKWSLTTNGDVPDTPAVFAGVAYFTDHGSTTAPSTLWAVNASTGKVIWSHSIPSYTGITGDTSRSTPTIAGGLLILGDFNQAAGGGAASGAYLFAVRAATGALAWKTELDTSPVAVVTSSPVVYGSTAVVGVSSLEEQAADTAGYPCCTFRGSVVALNTATGRILWRSYMAPANGGKPGGYSGNAVWSSTPVINPLNSLVYVTTGNNYTVPAGVCTQPGQTGCTATARNDYPDSIVALSLLTGAVTWAHPTLTADATTTACTNPAEECGPDFDFGAGPNLYTTTGANGQPEQLLGAGQKSGVYYALNPSTGQTVWQTKVGPGTELGGIEWGTATDGKRIYAAESDLYGVPYTVNGQTVTGGSWAALNAATGQLEWQTADPQGAPDLGFMSTANGVVYAPSDAGTGTNMYALNAATGAIDWSYASGGSVIGGAAIVNGTVYWGSGYYIGTDNNKLYAFGL